MTSGEKMVWAAVYGRELTRELRRIYDMADHVNEPERVRTAVSNAIEHAGDAVMYLRGANRDVRTGHGVDSSTYKLYRQMTAGGRPRLRKER